jgi:hypothetical protein
VRAASDRGTASVELALALPVLLLLVFGLIQLMLMVGTTMIMQQIAYEAVRSGAVESANQRAERLAAVFPRSPGLLGGAVQINQERSDDRLFVEVVGELALLPFFRQASMAIGSGGTVKVGAGASGKIEPYLGYK